MLVWPPLGRKMSTAAAFCPLEPLLGNLLVPLRCLLVRCEHPQACGPGNPATVPLLVPWLSDVVILVSDWCSPHSSLRHSTARDTRIARSLTVPDIHSIAHMNPMPKRPSWWEVCRGREVCRKVVSPCNCHKQANHPSKHVRAVIPNVRVSRDCPS